MFSYYIIVSNYIPKKRQWPGIKMDTVIGCHHMDVHQWDAPAGASESGETLLCRLLEDRGLVDTEQGFLSEG